MFAHQVIEDFNKMISGRIVSSLQQTYWLSIVKTIFDIQESFKFHLGDMTELIDSFSGLRDKGIFKEYPDFTRIPFKNCWFDYFDKRREKPEEGKTKVSRRGIFVRELRPDLILTKICNFYDLEQKWYLNLAKFVVRIGKNLSLDEDLDYLVEASLEELIDLQNFEVSFLSEREKSAIVGSIETLKKIRRERIKENACMAAGNIFPVYFPGLSDAIKKSEISLEKIKGSIVEDSIGDLSCLNTAILLLNCKNVETESHPPPKKLNKKRISKNKSPLFTFHTLKLKFPQKRSVPSGERKEAENHCRLHFCRGHFKKYTDENPLFGRISGLWWWQPHVRGTREGFVDKDYEVKIGG